MIMNLSVSATPGEFGIIFLHERRGGWWHGSLSELGKSIIQSTGNIWIQPFNLAMPPFFHQKQGKGSPAKDAIEIYYEESTIRSHVGIMTLNLLLHISVFILTSMSLPSLLSCVESLSPWSYSVLRYL